MSKSSPPPRAVALRYEGRDAPRVTAKGHGEVARRIVERAREHGIPIREDPALSELLAQVELGSEVPPALYLAVAEVLAFAYRVAQRAQITGD